MTDPYSESSGVVQQIRESPIDLGVASGHGDDVFLTANGEVLLLDETELRLLYKEIGEYLEGDE